MPFHPFVDGEVVASRPVDAMAGSEVDLLIGTTRDEMRMFLDPRSADLDRDRLRPARGALPRVARRRRTDGAGRARRRVRRRPAPADPGRRLVGDPDRRRDAPARRRDRRRPLGRDAGRPSSTGSTSRWPGGSPSSGACHAADLPYPFGTVDRGGWAEVLGPDAPALSDAVQAAWVAFARDGDPSCDELGAWPAYDTDRRATMLLAGHSQVVDDPDGDRRAAVGRARPRPQRSGRPVPARRLAHAWDELRSDGGLARWAPRITPPIGVDLTERAGAGLRLPHPRPRGLLARTSPATSPWRRDDAEPHVGEPVGPVVGRGHRVRRLRGRRRRQRASRARGTSRRRSTSTPSCTAAAPTPGSSCTTTRTTSAVLAAIGDAARDRAPDRVRCSTATSRSSTSTPARSTAAELGADLAEQIGDASVDHPRQPRRHRHRRRRSQEATYRAATHRAHVPARLRRDAARHASRSPIAPGISGRR